MLTAIELLPKTGFNRPAYMRKYRQTRKYKMANKKRMRLKRKAV